MPNKESIDYLRKLGVDVDKCHYMLHDTLESQNDFENLFEILTKFKDSCDLCSNRNRFSLNYTESVILMLIKKLKRTSLDKVVFLT